MTNQRSSDIIMTNSWSLLFDELKMTTPYFEGKDAEGRYHPDNPNQDFWSEDGIEFVGNPGAAQDTITFTSDGSDEGSITLGGDTVIYGGEGTDTISFGAAQMVPMDYMGLGEDHISFGTDTISFDLDMTTSKNPNRFKYSEERIIKELTDYISATYNQHYSAGDDAVQTLDLIEACGDGESFCRSNILKYASRYDKKGTARRDIMKILHYAVLLMHFNDKNAKRETYNQ